MRRRKRSSDGGSNSRKERQGREVKGRKPAGGNWHGNLGYFYGIQVITVLLRRYASGDVGISLRNGREGRQVKGREAAGREGRGNSCFCS